MYDCVCMHTSCSVPLVANGNLMNLMLTVIIILLMSRILTCWTSVKRGCTITTLSSQVYRLSVSQRKVASLQLLNGLTVCTVTSSASAGDHEQSWKQSLHTVFATYCAVHAMISLCYHVFLPCLIVVLHLGIHTLSNVILFFINTFIFIITVGPLLGPVLVIP